MKPLNQDIFMSRLKKATNRFSEKVEELNSINYFPVVDHDTGTNMYFTLSEALEESNGHIDLLIKNLIIHSKGNSGIILGKAISGFLTVLCKKKGIQCNKDMSQAVKKARNDAFSAVLHPHEGTILTLLDDMARITDWENKDIVKKSIENALEKTLSNNEYDAGAKGLYYLIEYFFELGLNTDIIHSVSNSPQTNSNLKYKYCTEFVVQLRTKNAQLSSFIEDIGVLGDSINYSVVDKLLKVHIHNNNPFYIFELAKKIGTITYKKIDNMKLEDEQKRKLVWIMDMVDDIKCPLTKYEIEYISLSFNDGTKELRQKMETIKTAENIILLTDHPEYYKSSSNYNNLFVVKTFGTFSQIAALMFPVGERNIDEFVLDIADITKICKSEILVKDVADKWLNSHEYGYIIPDVQMLSLFSHTNDECVYGVDVDEW